jgi:hypothetical protein
VILEKKKRLLSFRALPDIENLFFHLIPTKECSLGKQRAAQLNFSEKISQKAIIISQSPFSARLVHLFVLHVLDILPSLM